MSSATSVGTGASTGKATRREWVGLAVIALPCLLYSMDLTVLHLAIPQISAELNPTGPQLLWIVDIYGFVLASFLLTMGTLGDRIGRRRLLLIGAGGFGAASLLAAFSNSVTVLILARALLGLAGATLAPSTLSLIRHMFHDSEERTFAIGVWTASLSIGGAIGPIVGGVLLQHFGWSAVFLIAVPIMLLLLIVGPILLPEFVHTAPVPVDLVGTMQSVGALLLVIFAFKQIVTEGWQWSSTVSAAGGVAIGIAFMRRQNRLQHRLIDLRLMKTPGFLIPLLAYALGCFVSYGISLFYTQYLQLVLGLSPLEAGFWTLPAVIGFVTGSLLTPEVCRRTPAIHAMRVGLVLAAVGLATIALMDRHSSIAILGTGRLLASMGLAIAFVPAINLMVGSVPPERAGVASAVSETGSELGGALGIAVLGGIGMACYRSTLVSTIPLGITHEQAQRASETLGGAWTVAAGLPSELGTPLLDAARTAFEDSLHMSAMLSVAIVMGLIVAVTVTAPRSRHKPSRRHECR